MKEEVGQEMEKKRKGVHIEYWSRLQAPSYQWLLFGILSASKDGVA
jgi:hypothetical protein